MTGMEILALAQAVKGVGGAVKGAFDWASANKGNKEENAYLKYLRNQMNDPMYSQDEINRAIMTGGNQATSTMNRGVADVQGNLTMQGLDNSVIANQVPLKAYQEMADNQNINATNIITKANEMNKQKKRNDNLNYLEAKTKLAKLRRDRQSDAISRTFGGILDVGSTYGDFKAGKKLLKNGGTEYDGDVRKLYEQQKVT